MPSLFHSLFVAFILYFSLHLFLSLRCDHVIQTFSVRGKIEKTVYGVKTGTTLTWRLVDDRTDHGAQGQGRSSVPRQTWKSNHNCFVITALLLCTLK